MFFLKTAGVAIEAGSALVFELCWRQEESRKEFKVRFRRVGSDWRGLQDFCFQLLSLFLCHLVYSAVFVLCFSICLPLGVGLCKGGFLGMEKRQRPGF